MYIIRRIICVIAVIVVLTSFCACYPSNRNPLDYQNEAFTAEIRLTRNGSTLGGLLTLAPPTEDGTPRNAEIRFTSPESVNGICAVRRDGVTTVSLGKNTVGVSGDSFLDAVKLFSLDGAVTFAETAELDEKKVTLVKVTSADGNYDVYITENDTPQKIVGDGITVDVVWFEKG